MNYVFFADGFEEIEALTVVDVLRRAGMEVVTVSVKDDDEVDGAHGVSVMTDAELWQVQSDEGWFILPGGMPGATNLVECEPLVKMLRKHVEQGGKTAAICASPSVVLASLGLLNGRKATCYPGMAVMDKGVEWLDDMVVVDGNIVTGRGPAAAAEFALAIVEEELGEQVARQVADGMLL